MPEHLKYVGIGLYSLRDAARILHESPANVHRWASGYTWKARGRAGASAPLLVRDFPELAAQQILTFTELVELQLVSLFRTRGISMPTIRAAARVAASLFGITHPFARRIFRTDGREIFLQENRVLAEAEPDARKRIIYELPRCQLVMAQLVEPFLLELDYLDDFASQWWPLGRERRVVIDPARAFGKPVVHPESVPTDVLLTATKAGETPERIAWWYEVDVEAVRDAIEFEQQLAFGRARGRRGRSSVRDATGFEQQLAA